MNNKAFSYLFILFLSLFLVSELSGQAGMQRLFNADERDIINSCNAPLSGGGFYLVNFFNEPSTTQADSIGINITKHEPKGDLTWSKDYMIEGASYGNLNKILACQTQLGDSLMIVAVDETTIDQEGIKYIFKIDPEGEVVWSNQFSDVNKDDNVLDYISFPVVLRGTNKKINYIGTHDAGDTVAVHFEQMDSLNMTTWSNSYHAYAGVDSIQTDLTIVNAIMSRDSGFVMTTTTGEDNLRAGILDIDSLGVPRMAHSYKIEDPNIDFDMEFSAIAATTDTGFVIAGTCLHGFVAKGFVLKMDSLYNVQWAKVIELDPTNPLAFNIAGDVVVSESGEIVIAGKYLEGTESGYFSLFMGNDGTLINAVQYTPDESLFLDLDSGFLPSIDLNNDNTDGTIHFTTTGATNTFMGLSPIWIKMEQDGAATCHDSLMVNSLNDIVISRDTLGILTSQFAERTALDVRQENWDNYDVPIVNLQDTTYCPQDPIMYTIDATTDNAAAYAWSTGDTTATTFVTEEGEYSVTVTMEDRICFILCDTVMVSQQDYPVISLGFSDDRYCQDREFDLTVGATTGTSGGVEWNNGPGTPVFSTSNSIAIAHEPGKLYSVTITDNCDNQADTTFVVENYIPGANVVFGEDARALCEFGALFLSADWPAGYSPLSFMWEGGEVTQELRVEDPGTYRVTITDNCGHTAADEYTLTANDFDVPDPTVDILVQELNCDGGRPNIILDANGEAGRADIGITYIWNMGSGDQELTITEPGTYSVTVTDDCGQTVSDEIVITDEDLDVPDPSVDIAGGLACNGAGPFFILTVEGEAADGFMISTIQWSTNSSGPSIEVTEAGIYSVTVTDECGQTASAEIVVTEADLDPEDPSVSINNGGVNSTNCAIVLASQAEAGSGLNIVLIQWSTGSLDGSISVDEPGTYEVIVTDNCGQTATNSITLTAADFDIPTPEVTILVDEGAMLDSCEIRLVAEHNVEGTPTFMWSTGETTNAITADGYGVFTVTVSTCGKTTVAAYERTQDSDVRWPNLFFPQSTVHDINTRFGPQLDCPENFSGDYSLEIFNRWGKRVFMTDNIADRWSGTLNNQGNILEEDVYMYQWSYEGGEVQSGHVTLVRN